MRIFPLILLVLALSASTPARADGPARVDISPIRLDLGGARRSGVIALRNQGQEPVRYEVSASSWLLLADGEQKLEVTDALTVFPTVFEIPPGASKSIRVGLRRLPSSGEASYRLLVKQLPANRRQAGDGAAVQMLTNFSLPVFAATAEARAAPRLGEPEVRGARLSFALRNDGDRSFRATRVMVRGHGVGAESLFETELPAWYVLSRGIRRYELAIPPGACAKLRSIRIEAEIAGAAPLRLDRPLTCGT